MVLVSFQAFFLHSVFIWKRAVYVEGAIRSYHVVLTSHNEETDSSMSPPIRKWEFFSISEPGSTASK